MSIETQTLQLQHAIDDHFHRQATTVSSQSSQRLAGAGAGAVTGADAEQQAVTQFSALLVNMMIKSMRQTLPGNDPAAASGLSYDFFGDLLFQQYSEVIANADALGLNSLISDALSR